MAVEEEILEETKNDASLDDFEDYESYRLSLKQKIWTGISVGASFIIALVLFLPYDLIIRSSLAKLSGSGVAIEFDQLDPGFFGADQATNLRIHSAGSGIYLAATEVKSTLSKRNLLAGNAIGQVEALKLEIDLPVFQADTSSLDADLEFKGFKGAPGNMDGRIKISTGAVKLKKLPENLPIPVNVDDIKIKKININLDVNNGRFNFNGTNIDSNLFKISLSGTGVARQSIGSMSLDAKVCLRPTPTLEMDNKTIFDFYVFSGGAAGGELCFDLKGDLNNPQIKKQGT